MNIVAFVISLFAGLISFLQGGCATGVGAIGTGLGSHVGGYEGSRIASEGASIGGAGALIVLAALLSIIGGSFALPRKKASYWLLGISSGMCLLAVMVSGGMYKDAYVWLTAYCIAGGCAYAACQENQSEVKSISNSSSEGMHPLFLSESKRPQESPASVSSKTYEPIVGIKTDALIKRAFLFLEDGENYNAERYIEQALNQDPENPQVYMAKLMLEHRVKSPLELLNKLDIPLEEEKLFQRALRFADDEYKSQLEGLAQSNRNKLEQDRQEKEAKKLAQKEEQYQEILKAKEEATTSEELSALLYKIRAIMPYRDTEKIYKEVQAISKNERQYSLALITKKFADTSNDFRRLIQELEPLAKLKYKYSEELLIKAKNSLIEAERAEQRTRKMMFALIIVGVIIVIGSTFMQWYKNKKVITLRHNAMIAFFEERYDESNEAITAVISSDDEPATHAALLYIQALMKGGTSQAFIEKLDISKRQDNTAFNSSFKEANGLAERYTHTLNGNKFLGDTYLHGWGYDKDTNKALEYFNRSAESNDIYSQFAIAGIYEGRNNIQEALKWYQKLSDSGNAQAAEKVRELKAKMTAPKPPTPRQQEVTPSQDDDSTRLAIVQKWYEWGCDFLDHKNYPDAVKYFRLAANENYAPAQDKLGWMYQKGWGVKRDYSQAYDLYLKAANQGNNFAQASLGLLYYEGWGVPKDLEKSLTWYKKAAVQGHKTAIRRCKEIEQILANRIDPSQIDFPIPAFINGDKVNVRSAPNIESYSRKQLYSGHPVSVSRRSSETDGDWFYISTASGTTGWVRGDYVRFSDNVTRTQQERENRKHLLPSRGIVSKIRIGNRTGTQLNLRSFPHTDTSNIIREISTGDNFTALDIFAEEERDWYRIRIYDSGTEGWVSGRFINLQ